MAITIRSETSGSANGNASNQIVVTKPSSVSNGDHLVIFIGSGNDTTTITAPAGWVNEYYHSTATGNDRGLAMAYKPISNAAGEPSTYTFTFSSSDNAVWWIGSLSGILPTTPTSACTIADLSNATSPAAPSLTTTAGSSMVFAVWATNYWTSATMPGGKWETRLNNKNNATVSLNVASFISEASGSATGDVTVTSATTGMETTCGQFEFINWSTPLLVNGDGSHVLTSDEVSLTKYDPTVTLAIQNASSLLTSDNIALTKYEPILTLTAQDALSVLSSDNLTLTYTPPVGGCPRQMMHYMRLRRN